MKAMIAMDAMLYYPDHNLPFEIYTEASDSQLGTALMEKGKPVAYYSYKLNLAQKPMLLWKRNCFLSLLCIKNSMLCCSMQMLWVFMDQKNLTFHNLTSQRVIHWRNFLEEYSPKIIYDFFQGYSNG
jgi:hypothetical protein